MGLREDQRNAGRQAFIALMGDAEAAATASGDQQQARKMRIARNTTLALVETIDAELRLGTPGEAILEILAETLGLVCAGALGSLVQDGSARQAMELVLPVLSTSARSEAAILDARRIVRQGDGESDGERH